MQIYEMFYFKASKNNMWIYTNLQSGICLREHRPGYNAADMDGLIHLIEDGAKDQLVVIKISYQDGWEDSLDLIWITGGTIVEKTLLK